VDNHGYASIGALSRSLGSAGFGTHYRSLDGRQPLDGDPLPDPLPIDLAANAESLGARMIRTRTVDELRAALEAARGESGPVVVHIEVDRYAGVPSYEGWWDVPVAEVSEDARVRSARDEYERAREAQRRYLRAP
jgi:3D-(3,5/4)-trihydroxycyclohexane-1,2-dione acylhydrolase (decyclizing)